MTTKKRVFMGIPLLPPQQQLLYKVLEPARKQCSGVSWIPPENYHITLYFLGDTEADHINTICVQLNSLTPLHPKFTLSIQHIVFFPAKKPRMIWAVADHHDAFTQLANQIQTTFASPIKPHTSVIPHVTLARMKHPALSKQLQLPYLTKTLSLVVNTVVVWESFLSRSGARYQKLATFPLANGS